MIDLGQMQSRIEERPLLPDPVKNWEISQKVFALDLWKNEIFFIVFSNRKFY